MAIQHADAAVDPQAAEAFVGKVLGDTTGLAVTLVSSIGDRLGLWKELAGRGATTPAQLAAATGISERYAQEWLAAMAAAGYVTYEPATGAFHLPPAHAPALADEGGPAFFGGVQQEFIGFVSVLDGVVEAFRSGGGVAPSEYHEQTWVGISRFTSGWFNNLLLQQWVPAMPDVAAKLEQGASVADVGSGYGEAAIKLATAYPRSRFTGYEPLETSVAHATERARAAGVAERVRFVQLDASNGLPEQHDVITTFDVVHDAARPDALLRAIHDALKPDGIYVCLEINSSPNLAENLNPIGALLLSCSVLFCMTMSLSAGGAGLGTLGLPEPALREHCERAGFGAVRRVPLDNPFNTLYEIRPTIAGL